MGALGMSAWLLGLILGFVAIVESSAIGSYATAAAFLLVGGLMVAADPHILYPSRPRSDEDSDE